MADLPNTFNFPRALWEWRATSSPATWRRPGDAVRPFCIRPTPRPAKVATASEEGPTEEAKRHGDYIQGDSGRWAVFTNTQFNVLAKLAAHKTISKRQHASGLAFERTYVIVWGSASPSRDSTIPPIGGMIHETEQQAERMARHRARLHTILNRVGPRVYALLVSVCVYGHRLGPRRSALEAYRALLSGLDECAIAYGIQDEEAA